MEKIAAVEKTGKSLIDAHCQGCPTAFGELVRRYGGPVLRHLIQICGHRPQAEDCFQETFSRVHQKAHTFRGPRLEPWLLAIATRVAITGMRKDNRIRTVSLDNPGSNPGHADSQESATVPVEDNSESPLDEVVNIEQRQQVRAAVDSLPVRQRATLVLAYYRQLSYREVAKVMGCSIGTVKAQMHRALKTLARKLPQPGGETD